MVKWRLGLFKPVDASDLCSWLEILECCSRVFADIAWHLAYARSVIVTGGGCAWAEWQSIGDERLMSLKRQRGPCRAKLPEEVRTLRLHKDCRGAVCEVRRRVKEVCISSGGGEDFTCYFHSEGWDHWRVRACIEARSCRIHYRWWRHQLFIKGGALGRLKKTYMLTSLICFHPPPTLR